MNTQQLVGKAQPRGTRIHLVEVNASRTVCGLAHGVNPRYIEPRFAETFGLVEPSKATCPSCIKITESKGA